MAVRYYCEICEKHTSHTVQEGCQECREREEEDYKDYWMKQPYETQIRDLYERIRVLERQHHSPTLS